MFFLVVLAACESDVKDFDRDLNELMAWYFDNSEERANVDAAKLREVVTKALGDNAKNKEFAVKLVSWALNKLNFEQDDYDELEKNGVAEKLGGFFRWLAKGKKFAKGEKEKIPAALKYVFADNKDMENDQ